MINQDHSKSDLKISFPIIYGDYQLSKREFNHAVAKLQAKFNIDLKKATELTEDIIKCMIHENEPPEALEHETDSLCCPIWTFLRNKTIQETIEFYKNLDS